MSSLLLATLLLLPSAQAATSQEKFVQSYASQAANDYEQAVSTAEILHDKVRAFIAKPSSTTLTAAKEAWIMARKAYLPTEVYRFYNGPIDGENGPEGLLNAWPLDEVYIDYVVGNPDSGIINDRATFPKISKELLVSLNEQGGEKNISVGYHAIEFLLWGQDLDTHGAGNRPFN